MDIFDCCQTQTFVAVKEKLLVLGVDATATLTVAVLVQPLKASVPITV